MSVFKTSGVPCQVTNTGGKEKLLHLAINVRYQDAIEVLDMQNGKTPPAGDEPIIVKGSTVVSKISGFSIDIRDLPPWGG